ncbi:uncharacterized protein [Watersipora subatra]|uniref:uncharacterized protein isoform X2 n=1 Tax=Watersipora subatra TaxID=2589382 RepID=UPI00355C8D74
MVRKGGNSSSSTSGRNLKVPSHKDLVKTVSKQLKYYFEVKRQEDGFDLSGPECPRTDYPALKSRPMLLYEGLHDRSVKHFYSDTGVKQRITHMHTGIATTVGAKKTENLMKKTMDKVTYVPPWMGVGISGGNTKYTKNSEKYVTGTLGEWSFKPPKSQRKGFGNPEPTLTVAFSEPPLVKPRLRRSCPSGWIDNKECGRLISNASRILTSSEFRSLTSKSRSSAPTSQRTSSSAGVRPPSTEITSRSTVSVKSDRLKRLTNRPQSGGHTARKHFSYQDVKEDVVRDYESERTSQNLKENKIYYGVDGKRKPVRYHLSSGDGYLDIKEQRSVASSDSESKVPDWLRTQMRRQDVPEKKMPYNSSIQPVEVAPAETAHSEDVSKRENVRVRPRSAKRRKSKDQETERDRGSTVTLSDGTYERVDIDGSDSGEDAYYEDRACQTGWELLERYDQTENILYDGEATATSYKVIVHTGSMVGASTNASVYLILFGSRGRSPELPLLNCENHKIKFQQNTSDIFLVTCSYVGTLNKIEIGHNSESDAWYLDSVTVEDPTKEEAYEFQCAKWLSVKAEDKKTRRELVITASRKIESVENGSENGEDETKLPDITAEASVVPKRAKETETSNSEISTSHLRNRTNTAASEATKPHGSIGPPSETGSVESKESEIKRGKQEPFITSYETREQHRRDPHIREDFESDITLHTENMSLQSKHTGFTVSDSEDLTARFDEASVLSQSTMEEQQKQDRMEAFKAGQRAERARQKQEERKKEVEKAAPVDISHGPTIHQAAKSGNLARIKELIDHNADLKNYVDARGNTPLHLAAEAGHKEIVQYLVAVEADIDVNDQIGYEPVHMAALHGHVNCLMILVAMGASLSSKTNDCKLPIHLAAMNGNMETCKWLVANRSRLDEEDDFNRTPVDMAENNGHDDVALFLRTCINELKQRTSLESLLSGKEDWTDDKPERPVTRKTDEDSDIEGSLADLRREARVKEERESKQRAYKEMQQQLADSEMTYLDRIRYEVDNS